MSTTTTSAPTQKTTIAEKLAQAHEIAQLAMARIKARAAILTEKALDNLEMILDSRPDCPETIRRAAVNILSILGVPTSPTKAPATEFCPPETKNKSRASDSDSMDEDSIDEDSEDSDDSETSETSGTPPKPATMLALVESLEEVNLHVPFTKDQCQKIAEAVASYDGKPSSYKSTFHEVWGLLEYQQSLYLEKIIDGGIIAPPAAGAPLPPFTIAKFLTPPRVNPCQSSEVLSPTPKTDSATTIELPVLQTTSSPGAAAN